MKKILSVLFTGLVSVALFAANMTSTTTGSLSGKVIDREASTKAVVNLNLASGQGSEDNSLYLIGFTNNVSDIRATTTTKTGTSNFAMTFDPEYNKGKLSDNAYIYWVLKGPDKLNITFSTSPTMAADPADLADSSKPEIIWFTKTKVGSLNGSDDYGTESDVKNNGTETTMIYNRADAKNSQGYVDYGYVPFTIETESLADKPAVNYSGTLYLKVTSGN